MNHTATKAGVCNAILEVKGIGDLGILIKDPEDSRFYAKGIVSNNNGRNFLELFFFLKSKDGDRSKNLQGQEMLRTILSEFEAKGVKIDAFEATWTDNMKEYNGPSDNLVSFAIAYKNAFLKLAQLPDKSELPEIHGHPDSTTLASIEAASVKAIESTWTASQVHKMGMKYLESIEVVEETNRIGSDGYSGKITIRVIWGKSLKKKFSFKDSGSRGRSAMPRFHNFIEYLSKLKSSN